MYLSYNPEHTIRILGRYDLLATRDDNLFRRTKNGDFKIRKLGLDKLDVIHKPTVEKIMSCIKTKLYCEEDLIIITPNFTVYVVNDGFTQEYQVNDGKFKSFKLESYFKKYLEKIIMKYSEE